MSQWQLNIIRFENGMIAVTDYKEQIPKLQGSVELAIPRICRWLRRKEHKEIQLETQYWYCGFMAMFCCLGGVYSWDVSLIGEIMLILSGGWWMLHLQAVIDLQGVE